MFNNTRNWIARNARPLDFARWRCHFEGGDAAAVLNALAAYQNADGGFGHALEPDAWNPISTPMQTWAATEILKELGGVDPAHEIVRGILQYLAGGADFDGRVWANTVPSNNDYPHAPWWHTDSQSACHTSYNPTACLVGFALAHADKSGALYQTAARVAAEAVQTYLDQGLLADMHTAGCYIRLLEYCEQAGREDLFDMPALKAKLKEQVKNGIERDRSKWEFDYVCKPSQFFNSPDSVFYPENAEIAQYECEFIIKTRLADGTWHIPWNWADYPEQWVISKNWWKANAAILNTLYLKNFGML